jgi:hypothetical protein
MNIWEAFKALDAGKKIRIINWGEGAYIYKDIDGNYLTHDGHACCDFIKINDNDIWEIYDNRQDADLAWRILFKNVMEAESYIGAYIRDSYECNKCGCDNCIYSTVCNIFDNLYNELERLNQYIKLDEKHEFEE